MRSGGSRGLGLAQRPDPRRVPGQGRWRRGGRWRSSRAAGRARGLALVAVGALALVVPSGARAQAAPPAVKKAEPLRILHADRAPLDRGQEVMVLEGHVRVAKGTSTLSGERLTWNRADETLEIRGDVVVADKDFRLTADHMLYDLADDAATAWGRPRVVQDKAGATGEKVVLRAVQLRLFPGEGRVEAIEDVLVEQTARPAGAREDRIEMQVTCRVAEVLARGRRNIFKGDVRVNTPDITAEAGRMLYEQESRRVYLLDGARVWNYDSDGKPLDELRGDKVIYFLDEGRTIALGGVRAAVHPDESPAARPVARARFGGDAR